MGSYGVIIFSSIIALIALLLMYWIIKGLSSGRKKLKLPKGHEMQDTENSWSNNAIRKQGEEGKGIR